MPRRRVTGEQQEGSPFDTHLRIDAHHLVHWAHGGETDLENLVLLCYSHHWRVHEGGWQLVRGDVGPFRRMSAIPPTPTYHPWIRPPEIAVAV
jgi:hypothetical protein